MAGRIQNEDIRSAAELVSAGATAASLPNDDKIYVTANGVNKTLKQAILDGDIGGGGGSKNYLATKNGGFESNSTTYWSLFNTTLTSLIPTGSITAGAASITTFAATATGKLAGNYSLNTASSGAMTAGQGFITDAFTIDVEDYATVMSFVAHYKVQSGTLNMSATSSNTFAFYIYDVTNSAWIQPAGVYGMDGSGNISGTFQTTAASTQYRLAVICINATGGAVSVNWDDFSIGPQGKTQGFKVAALMGRTGSLSFSGGTPADMIYNQFLNDTHGAYNTSTGVYTVPVSGYYSISASAYIQGTVTANSELHITDTSNNNIGRIATIYGSTVANQTGQINGTVGKYFNAGTQFKIRVYVGAGSSLQVYGDNETTLLTIIGPDAVPSSDTDTRVVAARAYISSASVSVGANALIPFNTTSFDTHGAFVSGSSAYRVPVSGIYEIIVDTETTTTTNNLIYINGSTYQRIGPNAVFGTCQAMVSLVAGDLITVFSNNAGAVTYQGTSQSTSLSVKRLSGPATIAASESVNCRYSNSTTSVTSSYAPVIFSSKVYDTHGAYNTSTGSYTIPVSGKYAIKSTFQASSITLNSTGQNLQISVYKNGSVYGQGQITYGNGNNLFYAAVASDTVQCIAGDTIAIYAFCSVSTSGQGGNCSIAIERIGN